MALTVFFALGLPQLETETSYRSFLGADHPSVVQLDEFIDMFGGGLPLAAVWNCDESEACAEVFDPASLAMSAAVVEQMEGVAGVRRIESPSSSSILAGTEDGFEVLRAGGRGWTAGGTSEARRACAQQPTMARQLDLARWQDRGDRHTAHFVG